MRKMTWEVTRPHKVRCEVCKGAFGLTRRWFEQKQFCSKQCLEWYMAERTSRLSRFKQSLDVSQKQSNPV
jgi:hypothetical protein